MQHPQKAQVNENCGITGVMSEGGVTLKGSGVFKDLFSAFSEIGGLSRWISGSLSDKTRSSSRIEVGEMDLEVAASQRSWGGLSRLEAGSSKWILGSSSGTTGLSRWIFVPLVVSTVFLLCL